MGAFEPQHGTYIVIPWALTRQSDGATIVHVESGTRRTACARPVLAARKEVPQWSSVLL